MGGLTKASLMKNKRGKAVSKKQHAAGKKAFKHIQDWVSSCKAARKALDSRASLQSMANLTRAKLCMQSRRHCLLIDEGNSEEALVASSAPQWPLWVTRGLALTCWQLFIILCDTLSMQTSRKLVHVLLLLSRSCL